ncbi:MAG: dockerin type I domain-containing protein [Phycisphaerae bacterium]|jgi:hypothetical protein
MKKFLNRLMLSLVIVSGLISSLQAMHQVNISGATLFQSFFLAPASTNDYIDVDGDGLYGFFVSSPYVDQLAATYVSGSGWNPYWAVLYRGVGSGTGLTDLVNWYNSNPSLFTHLSVPSDYGYVNRIRWASLGALEIPPANSLFPGGCPVDSNNIDIAVMDVPTTWFVYNGATTDAQWSKKPMQAGYGRNPVKSWNGTQSNQLKSLGTLNTNTTSPDAMTVFDTELAWVPIAIIVNQGVGLTSGNISSEQMQYLSVAGRMPSGENLAAATRDSGSGTRNAAMNTLGMDPSWARGDNFGNKFDIESDTVATTKTGKNHRISNCGGSGIMENAVQYSRLAVGYTGLCSASRANEDARGGKYEICSIKNIGGSVYVRPTLDNILNNSDVNSGWRIGGNETFATVGSTDTSALYTMLNPYAAAYINNITASIADFITSPGLDASYNMPGEYLANQYFLVAAIDMMPSPTDPTSFIANARLNQSLQNWVAGSAHELATNPVPVFGSVKPSGIVPVRVNIAGGGTYSDGRTSTYIDNGGNVIAAGTELSERNKVAGDFNYEGNEKHKRNMNDIAKMVQAVKNPRTFEQNVDSGGYHGTQVGDYVMPEVIGDFDGDGNFVAADVRYFADGLAIDTVSGKLNRSEGFAKVDQADKATGGNGNYFNTTLATGRAYDPNSGWSKADIITDVNVTPGANPQANGVVNAKDIDWMYKVLRGGIKATALGQTLQVNLNVRSNVLDWNNLNDAALMDLSCDMNGDLIIDSEDMDIVVIDILGTNYGDVNLDSAINAADRNIIIANISTSYGKSWADGDMNGDGYVTAADLEMYRMTLLATFSENWLASCSSPSWCDDMDYNHSGTVNFADFATLAQNW